jgi:hypothetical protein
VRPCAWAVALGSGLSGGCCVCRALRRLDALEGPRMSVRAIPPELRAPDVVTVVSEPAGVRRRYCWLVLVGVVRSSCGDAGPRVAW